MAVHRAATPRAASPRPASTRLAMAIGLASVGLGTWEVGLARLAGLLYTRTLAYQALAVALLALGLGAWWAAKRPRPQAEQAAFDWLAPTLLLGAAACTLHDVAWALAAFAWPFALFGVVLTGAWRSCRAGDQAGGQAARQRQYRWELAGAAAGLAVVGPISVAWAGSLAAAWVGALCCAVAALWLGDQHLGDQYLGAKTPKNRAIRWFFAIICVVGIGATGLGFPPLSTPLLAGPGLGIHLRHTVEREGHTRLLTRHSTWARTDWLRAPAQDMSWIFAEGRFVARSVAWDGRSRRFLSPRVQRLARLKRIPWQVRERGANALVIGAGAGFDVAVALQEGAAAVTAVEINQDTVAFTRRDGDRNGAIYDRPEVTVVVADGRRWTANHTGVFDHIQLSLMDTAPGGVRGRSTAHSRLFTREAMALWMRHLRSRGVLTLIFSQRGDWQQAMWQLAAGHSDAVTVLNSPHPSPWRAHVWGAAVANADPRDDPFSHLLLYSPTPWTPAERAHLDGWATAAGAVAGVTLSASQRVLTDDRPSRPRLGQSSIERLLAALAALLLVALSRTAGQALKRRRVSKIRKIALSTAAAALAGLAVTWLQVSMVEWVSAATGAPALALGATIAAMLLGAALGAALPWRRWGPWAATAGAALMVTAGPHLVANATHHGPVVATIFMALPVLVLSLPLGIPWLTAMGQVVAWDAPGAEGRVVAADGLGAVMGAGTAGVLVQSVGLSGCGAAAVVAFGVVAGMLTMAARR